MNLLVVYLGTWEIRLFWCSRR